MRFNDGIMQMTVQEMSDELCEIYAKTIMQGKEFSKLPSVMLWGPPGVGKSQGVKQVAKRLEELTGKRVVVTDVRLLLFNPVDLRGIPTSNAEKTLAIWLKPKIFSMDESEEVVNILFLDEISAAPQSVQAAAYQITLDRAVGEHRLPKNCLVIAAGNRVTDRSVAVTMPKALANRLCHLEIASDPSAWHSWAVACGVHPKVCGFLDANPSQLMDFVAEEEGVAFPTPRSWEMVSNILYVAESMESVFSLIVGCVGEEAAQEFLFWCRQTEKAPSVSEIFAGKVQGVPLRPELLYALVANMVFYAKSCTEKEGIGNAIQYAMRMPTEFKNKFFHDLYKVRELRKNLRNIPIFYEWMILNELE